MARNSFLHTDVCKIDFVGIRDVPSSAGTKSHQLAEFQTVDSQGVVRMRVQSLHNVHAMLAKAGRLSTRRSLVVVKIDAELRERGGPKGPANSQLIDSPDGFEAVQARIVQRMERERAVQVGQLQAYTRVETALGRAAAQFRTLEG